MAGECFMDFPWKYSPFFTASLTKLGSVHACSFFDLSWTVVLEVVLFHRLPSHGYISGKISRS